MQHKGEGEPSQFTLSGMLIDKLDDKIECVEFRCPRCAKKTIARIDQIAVVEETLTIASEN